MTQEPGAVEKLPPITESQRRAFDELVDLINHNYADVRPAIVTAVLNGHQVAVVVAVPYNIDVHDPDAEFDLHPAAILLDDDTLDRLGDLLQPPDGVEVIDERAGPSPVEICYNDGPPHPRTECHVDRCGLDPSEAAS